MEPIINPWIIYCIDVIHSLCVVSVLAIAVSVIGILVVLGNSSPTVSEDEKKIVKAFFKVLLASVLLLIILPSKNTMLTMLALQYVTPDNIQIVQGNVVDFVEQVAQAVKSVK
jgi:predicted MFS family arabinose efflux permease